ncbi:ParB N-terminal domain-containing protein [Caulobacter segnis]|nr:ParB N-terminal domain-containing protein [Caulobacter segnis]
MKTSGEANIQEATQALPPARRRIRLDRIIVADRLRAIEPAAVDVLAVSIQEGVLNTPITVRPLRVDGDDMIYGLVTGAHRYAAAEKLGWVDIECSIRNLTDDQARMVEIDENLIRRGLTPLDRAVFVNERLQVWAKLNPGRVVEDGAAPKRGRPANSDKLSQFLGDVPPSMGFSAETAADLGVDKRTVERALIVARGISAETRATVAGTKIAKNEGLLRQLAAVPDKAEQLRAAEALVTEKAKSFPDALLLAAGKTPAPQAPPRPADEAVAAFLAIWKKAPPTHQDAILHALSGQRLPKGWTVAKGAADA